MRVRFGVLLLALALTMGFAVPASAAPIVLTFEGLGNEAAIGNFYNGGAGTNYGIEFSPNALAVIDADAGGSGNIGGEPSPNTAMFFLTGTAVLNMAAGFDTGFSFYYSAINNPGSIAVYDGLNATGNLLATLILPVTPSNGGDPSGSFSPFYAIGVPFAGTAKSIDFGGTVNQIAFDDVTFGSTTPGTVPDAGSSLLLLGLGLAGLRALKQRLG